ncbi:helix-turn-helix domain-containing protein [Thermobifida alba]|uniref:Helix-turn-helix domain-containing protein n=1 Tax=Thermobifida alba TaxID=53522 RepID=A0ABY4L396_THEAE|nr:helix-turn-helix domain-containing protein [Thermobifida alba]
MVKHPPAWSRFGAEVRRLRLQAGYSQTQLAKAIPLSQSMLSGIELGHKGSKRDHAEALDRAFNTDGRLVRLWDSLNSTPSHPDWFQEVLKLERKAVEIRQYQPIVMPGLLQTEDYARALIRPAQPWANAAKVEELVHARMGRREILTVPDRPLSWFVVDQVVIDRVIESPAVMKEQLTYLLSLIEDSVIRFQVVSQETPVHPGSSGAIRIMTFDDRPTMVYTDHALGGHLSAQTEEVRYCSAIFSALQSEALSPSDSADYIRSRKDQL